MLIHTVKIHGLKPMVTMLAVPMALGFLLICAICEICGRERKVESEELRTESETRNLSSFDL
jgi:hypothetical protein